MQDDIFHVSIEAGLQRIEESNFGKHTSVDVDSTYMSNMATQALFE